MAGRIEIDRLLMQDPINAFIFTGAYKSLDGNSEQPLTIKDLLEPVKQDLEKNKLEMGYNEISSRILKLGKCGLLMVIPGSPFSGLYSEVVELNNQSQSYVEFSEKIIRDYPRLMNLRKL
jgi:hypothetical protein